MSSLRAKAVPLLLVTIAAGALAAFWPASQPGAPAPGDLAFALHPPAPVSAILDRSCRDCHSVNTRYPWYSRLPVASDMIQHDIRTARKRLDLSNWDAATKKDPEWAGGMLANICEQAREGTMPPLPYRLIHRNARLNPTDTATLCAWSETESKALSAKLK